MAAADENTSLLRDSLIPRFSGAAPHAREDASSEDDSDEDAFEEIDEPVDVLMARYGSSVGSLGLSGDVGSFGTPLNRRGSITLLATGLRRRSSRPSIPGPTIAKRPGFSRPSRRKSSGASVPGDIPALIHEDIEGEESSQTDASYLGGVSKSRFWVCFISILLTYFVRIELRMSSRRMSDLCSL